MAPRERITVLVEGRYDQMLVGWIFEAAGLPVDRIDVEVAGAKSAIWTRLKSLPVFVPGYDAATNANLAVARELVMAEDVGLLADEATRASLLEGLRTQASEAMFSMSQGRADHLSAQGG